MIFFFLHGMNMVGSWCSHSNVFFSSISLFFLHVSNKIGYYCKYNNVANVWQCKTAVSLRTINKVGS